MLILAVLLYACPAIGAEPQAASKTNHDAKVSLNDLIFEMKRSLLLNNTQDALSYAEIAHALAVKTLGPNHPRVAKLLLDLGNLHNQLHQPQKALTHYQQSLKIEKSQLEPKPIHIATCFGNMGHVYRKLGDLQSATVLYDQSLRIREETLPEGHPGRATGYGSMAVLYYELNNLKQAESFSLRAIKIYKEHLLMGGYHPLLPNIQNTLAKVYESKQQFVKAEKLYQESIAIHEVNHISIEAPKYAETLHGYGGCLYKQRKFRQAIPILERAVKMMTDHGLRINHRTASYLHGLAELHIAITETEVAKEYLQESLEITRQTLGPNHINARKTKALLDKLNQKSVAVTHSDQPYYIKLFTRAKQAQDQHMIDDALKYFEQALAAAEADETSFDKDTAVILAHLAEIQAGRKQYDKAESYFERALALSYDANGRYHQQTMAIKLGLADNYFAYNNYAHAELLYDQLFADYKKVADYKKEQVRFDGCRLHCVYRLIEICRATRRDDEEFALRALAKDTQRQQRAARTSAKSLSAVQNKQP
ncbi:tetratricopeptide repeat protein [Poriferisphaera sp. WC338]|uniref:tetratricopeptide repeat protein n=1 Tax=Poriferisphaera sp. WC338 TaxID=3425129 RepID=UPI003D814520